MSKKSHIRVHPKHIYGLVDVSKIVSEKINYPHPIIKKILDATFEEVVARVSAGGEVRFYELGTFRAKKCHPRTLPDGSKTAGSTILSFHATKELSYGKVWSPDGPARAREDSEPEGGEDVPEVRKDVEE